MRSQMAGATLTLATAALVFTLGGCAILHKVQLSDVDARSEYVMVPFDIKVSETGVDLNDVSNIQRGLFNNSQEANAIGDAAAILALFQQGPRTGAPVYSDTYALKLVYALHQQCPDGRVTGLMSVRETRKYPVISGEIVKVNGFCLRRRAPANSKETNPETDRDGDVEPSFDTFQTADHSSDPAANHTRPSLRK